MTTWHCLPFAELSLHELYELLALRERVFVVEQNCPYLDCDGLDPECWHLRGVQGGKLVAYSRILPPGLAGPEPRIGRVITSPEVRRQGVGKELTAEGLRRIDLIFGPSRVKISAQLYLQRFYEGFGFVRQGDVYDEDGIPHIAMLRLPSRP